MGYVLDNKKRQELLQQHKKERDSTIADRIKVVLLMDDGWSYEKIAKALFISEISVRRHFTQYTQENILKPCHKGSEPILDEKTSQELKSHLQETIYVKIKDIKQYILKTFEIEMSKSAIYVWLKKNGFSYKKPAIVPAKANVEEQLEFVEHYNDLMKESALEGEPVLFADAVHPSQQTRPAYGWFCKKTAKPLESNAGRKRVNVMGAFNLETVSLEYEIFETIDGEATIEFLKKLEKAYPQAKKINLILDRAGYYTCAKVREFLKTSRIKVHFFPPRSPNLNSIERLWKVMHQYVSNNKVYEKFSDFKKSLLEFFDQTIPTIKEQLISSVTDNFRILDPVSK
jgi:transposase